MIICKVPKVNRHAIVRFRERVIPWDDSHTYCDSTIRFLIQRLVTKRICEAKTLDSGAILLKTKYLCCVYQSDENEVKTIFPHVEWDKSTFERLLNYYVLS